MIDTHKMKEKAVIDLKDHGFKINGFDIGSDKTHPFTLVAPDGREHTAIHVASTHAFNSFFNTKSLHSLEHARVDVLVVSRASSSGSTTTNMISAHTALEHEEEVSYGEQEAEDSNAQRKTFPGCRLAYVQSISNWAKDNVVRQDSNVLDSPLF